MPKGRKQLSVATDKPDLSKPIKSFNIGEGGAFESRGFRITKDGVEDTGPSTGGCVPPLSIASQHFPWGRGNAW
jgi:hypothetical protein